VLANHYFCNSASEGAASCLECPEGYFCPENATDFTTYTCPAGHYCPNGTMQDTQFPCDVGYYNPNTGGSSVADCLPCAPGSYCATTGLSAPTGLCTAGYYCTAGAWSPTPLDIGNFTAPDCVCPVNKTGGMCLAGTYCPSGSSAPTDCDGGELSLNIHLNISFFNDSRVNKK